MNDRHDAIADVRQLAVIDREQLASSWADSEAKMAIFQEITATPVELADSPTHNPRTSPSRRPVVLAATLAALSLATIAGAVVFLTADASTSVGCHTPDGAVAVVGAVTGDPVADCSRLWTELTGTSPPTLIAYDNTSGGIEVVPADTEVPDGWRKLDPGVVQDPGAIELEAALADYIDGLHSDCYRSDAARRLASGELDRLGLGEWTIDTERGEADGAGTCTYYYLDPSRQRVVLIPMDGLVSPDETPHTILADQLRHALSSRCLSVDEAAAQTRQLAIDAGLDDPNLVIHKLVDDTADCTRADMNIGGRTAIYLHGPAS